jgi:hypothetical protein
MSNEHTDQTPVVQLDHSKRYTCPELKGFAVYVRGWEKTYESARFLWTDPESGESFEVEDPSEGEWSEDPSTGRVRVVCVGDDKEHLVEYDSLTELGERDYCHTCGQVGCKHDGRDDDPDADALAKLLEYELKRATAEHYSKQAEQAQQDSSNGDNT